MSSPNGPVVPEDRLPSPGAFDAHTHMDIMGLPVDGVLAAARSAGISRVVNVGCDIPSSQWSVACAAEYPEVYAAVAIHPNETAPVDAARDTVLAAIEALAASPRVVAIGETGLDYYRDWSPRDVQRAWFRAHIEIAQADREDADDPRPRGALRRARHPGGVRAVAAVQRDLPLLLWRR